MKAIDLTMVAPSLSDLLDLAREENVLLRTAEGREYVLVAIDDFDDEVAAVRRNPDLMRVLEERSSEPAKHSLAEVKAQLGLG